MKTSEKLQLAGIILFLVSPLIGFGGAAWGAYSSFGAMEAAETAGIGPVGDGIQGTYLFTSAGMLGTLLGTVLFIVGRSRSDQ